MSESQGYGLLLTRTILASIEVNDPEHLELDLKPYKKYY